MNHATPLPRVGRPPTVDGVENPAVESVAETLQSRFAAQCEAMVLGDVTELDSLLTRDFVLTHLTGYRQPRAAWLRDIDEDEMRYHAVDVVETRVDLDGTAPVLNSRTITEATLPGGSGTWHLQLRQTYREQDGVWLAERSVASTW